VGGANFVVDSAGQVYAWGTNAVAELGLGHPKDVGVVIDQPQRVEGLPPVQNVWPSYDYVPGFHGGPTIALTLDGKQLRGWGPLKAIHGSHTQKTRKMPEHQAREWCQKHNDGHMDKQLNRCVQQLWTDVVSQPYRLQTVPEGTWDWATAGLVNRGSAFIATAKSSP